MPIEDPVWESFAKYRAEHREAVARREEEMRQRNRETSSGEKENVEHWQFLQKKKVSVSLCCIKTRMWSAWVSCS